MQTKKNTTLIFVALGLLFLGAAATNLTPQPITTTDGENSTNNNVPTAQVINPAPTAAPAPASQPANAKQPRRRERRARDLGTVCTRDLKVLKSQKLLFSKQVFSYEEGMNDGKVYKVVTLADSAKISDKCQKRSVFPKDIKITKNKLRNRFNIFGVDFIQINGKSFPAITSELRANSAAAAIRARRRQFEPKHFDGDEKFKAIAANSRFEFERLSDHTGKLENVLVLVTN